MKTYQSWMQEETISEAIPLALPLAGGAASKLLGGAMVGAGAAGLMRNIFRSDASNRSKAMRRGSKITPAQAQARQAKEDRKAAARDRAASGQTTPKPTQTTPKVGNKGKNRVDPALERSANEVLRRIRSEQKSFKKVLPEGNAGPSTPVKIYDTPRGKEVMPHQGGAGPGKVRLKPGLRLAHREPDHGEELNENPISDMLKGAQNIINKYNKKQQQTVDTIKKIRPGIKGVDIKYPQGKPKNEEWHPLDEVLYDPLDELYSLYEAEMNVMDKPDMMANSAPNNESPNKGNYRHPVTMKRQEIDALVAQGMNPISAHQSVHGEVDTGETTSKGKLAGTLGRIADNGVRSGVIVEPEKGSILAKDAEIERELDQVTANDLASPMNQQVPDRNQTAADQYTVSEELEITEEYDYNLDVAYLQKFGRA